MIRKSVYTGLLISLLMSLLIVVNPVSLSAHATDKVYFVSDRDQADNYDIYSMDQDGSNITRLTSNESIDNHPDISPNGSVIVFSSNRNVNGKNPEGDFELFLANPTDIDGTGCRQVFCVNSFNGRFFHLVFS